MKRNFYYPLLGLLFAISIVALLFLIIQPADKITPAPTESTTIGKIQECPTAWYDNKMPTIGTPPTTTEYFIFQGERHELAEFDLLWVEKNCEITKQVVF